MPQVVTGSRVQPEARHSNKEPTSSVAVRSVPAVGTSVQNLTPGGRANERCSVVQGVLCLSADTRVVELRTD